MLVAAVHSTGSFALHGVDLVIVILYLVAMVAIGAWVGRSQQSTLEYFLGDRNLPWWTVLLSIVATETSTVTFLSIPGMAYAAGGDMRFLQITFGYMLGRVLVCFILLPLYFRGEPFTAYEVLEHRFGKLSRRATSLLFLVMRSLADGLRLYLSAVVLREAIGLELWASIVAMGVVTVIYTYLGGVKSVIWNDCIQFVIYILGAVAALIAIIRGLEGGWDAFRQYGLENNKFLTFDFDPSLVKPTMTFWAGLIGGAFLTGATHGVDQLTVQRLLSARNQRSAAVALISSGVVVFLQFILFLVIGVALAAYYSAHPPATPFGPGENDRVFAHFIINQLPAGLVGLTLAAVFAAAMSTVSGSLNSSATVLVKDVLAPLSRSPLSDETQLRLSRAATAAFGLLQIVIALSSYKFGLQTSVVNQVLAIASFASGPMLGLYLLGVLTRVDQRAALGGFLIGIAVLSYLALGTALAWPWYAAAGSLCTFAAGVIMQQFFGPATPKTTRALVAFLAVLGATTSHAAELPILRPDQLGLDAAQLDRIDALVEADIAAGNLPGCVVAIGRSGALARVKTYGQRQVEPTPEPMTADTVFDMASLTKPIATATSIMILVERGQVRLRNPVAEYIPEFAQNGKAAITVEQLLTHQSGLIPDNPLADYEDGPVKAWERMLALKPRETPGTKFVYSDVNFMILGELIRRVTGSTVDEFAAANIFRPLEMNDTGYRPGELLRQRTAPTEKRDGKMIRGDVHDPRAFLLGGVAGHAGLFSDAADLAKYCNAFLAGARPGDGSPIVMSRATLAEMLRPREIAGQRRALGWDVRSQFSSNRGELYSSRAFGHGGFTGTAMWIDPELDLFVIFLSNRLHPDGTGNVNPLAGRIGTIAAAAIKSPNPLTASATPSLSKGQRPPGAGNTLAGIDVLERDGYAPLRGRRLGLITNHTGLNRDGKRTIDLLHDTPGLELIEIFSPEHGIAGKLDESGIKDAVDEKTKLPIYSLYGKTLHPSKEALENIDCLVYDIQDIGARFYTYLSTMCLAMEEAAKSHKRFVVLDRPNPLGGELVEGPLLDAGRESFVGIHTIPVRHGMTVGEVAQLYAAEKKLDLDLTVVRVENWRRGDYGEATNLMWVNPSPNIRSLEEAVIYPGIGLLETTNLSVGRGTDSPFEVLGAPWIDARKLASELNALALPGVRFIPLEFTPDSSKFTGEKCGGVNIDVVDRAAFRPVSMGLAIACTLRRLYPDKWEVDALDRLLINRDVLDAIKQGLTASEIEGSYRADLENFISRRKPYLIYSP
jgi:SSS family transporter